VFSSSTTTTAGTLGGRSD